MYYFKHHNTASHGLTIRTLWDNGHYDAIAFWWLLLETISRFETPENRGTIKISWKTLSRDTGWLKPRLVRVMGQLTLNSDLRVEHDLDGELIQVTVPKWLKFQERRGGKHLPKNDQKVVYNKNIDNKSKKKKETATSFSNLFMLKQEDLELILTAYNISRQEFDLEYKKMEEYIADPERNKRGRKMGMNFITNWIKRGQAPVSKESKEILEIKKQMFAPHPTNPNLE